MSEKLKLQDGYYRYKSTTLWILKVTNDQCIMYRTACMKVSDKVNESMIGQINYGDFGEAPNFIQKEAEGQTNYNFQMSIWRGFLDMKGIIKSDQKTLLCSHFMNGSGNLEVIWKLSDEEVQEMIESGDDLENISSPYKIQPEKKGKFVWVTGPPGAGKSTSAQLFGRNNEYVYFEADSVMTFGNPYVSSHVVNPSMSQWYQKHLKVVSVSKSSKCLVSLSAEPKALVAPDFSGTRSFPKNGTRSCMRSNLEKRNVAVPRSWQ